MLTHRLREQGFEVLSFVENNYGEGHGPDKPIAFEDWMETDQAERAFGYDTNGATGADVVVYIGPAGTDAWAEVGAAWATNRPILGLWAKGEPAGLMRKMITSWFARVDDLLAATAEVFGHEHKEP